jgi:hypothetical protein
VRELQNGLWWWEARHPEWTAEDEHVLPTHGSPTDRAALERALS